MRTVDQYVLRVLGDQWAAPARTPSLLDVSRDGNGIAAELARVGFRVTRVTLDDSSLETVSERLAGIHRHFDAVVVRDVLEAVDDWPNVVSRSVRRLRPGGVFVYGVSAGTRRPWLSSLLPRRLRPRGRPMVPVGELVAILRRSGLLQGETISLAADTLDVGTTTYIGYSIMRGDPALATDMRWDFTGTGERWLAEHGDSRGRGHVSRNQEKEDAEGEPDPTAADASDHLALGDPIGVRRAVEPVRPLPGGDFAVAELSDLLIAVYCGSPDRRARPSRASAA